MAFYICTFTAHHSNTTIIYCLSLSLWHILTCSDAHTLHCKLRSQKKLLFAGGVAWDLFVSVVVVQGRTKDSASTARFLWMSIQRERIMFCAISCTTNHILRKLKYFREDFFFYHCWSACIDSWFRSSHYHHSPYGYTIYSRGCLAVSWFDPYAVKL